MMLQDKAERIHRLESDRGTLESRLDRTRSLLLKHFEEIVVVSPEVTTAHVGSGNGAEGDVAANPTGNQASITQRQLTISRRRAQSVDATRMRRPNKRAKNDSSALWVDTSRGRNRSRSRSRSRSRLRDKGTPQRPSASQTPPVLSPSDAQTIKVLRELVTKDIREYRGQLEVVSRELVLTQETLASLETQYEEAMEGQHILRGIIHEKDAYIAELLKTIDMQSAVRLVIVVACNMEKIDTHPYLLVLSSPLTLSCYRT
jgi:hypothetical protein